VAVKLSICIPTYNRAVHLSNCLKSIADSRGYDHALVEVCVADNCSSDDTSTVVADAQVDIPIVYYRAERNQGRVINYLKVVEMAQGEFVWLIGDDDLLLPSSLVTILGLLNSQQGIDYFFVNSYCLSTDYVLAKGSSFSTFSLPENMPTFAPMGINGRMPFFRMIDPDVSFDFLGAMFLSIFRRKLWDANAATLDSDAVIDEREFSHFDNTFPHVRVFAAAFYQSNAYRCDTPLSVNLAGAREWSSKSPLINIVRLPEALNLYRSYGLPFWSYVKCKHYALRTFIPDVVRMLVYNKTSGLEYINIWKLVLTSFFYPNAVLSPVYYLYDKYIKSEYVSK
jgi:glycosyltransferase involved in cell wall biosynthesis